MKQVCIPPLDLSQTIDGVTVALDWAYADPWLIDVGLHPRINAGGGKIVSADLRLANTDMSTSVMIGGYVGSEAHWFEWRYVNFLTMPQGQLPIYSAFDELPDRVDLELAIVVRMPTILPTPDPNQPTLAPEVTPDPTPKSEPVFQTFEFEFSLPVYPIHIVRPEITFEKNGVKFLVNQLAISPTKTIIDLCYQIEDADGQWYTGDIDAYFGENETSNYEAQGIPVGRFEGWYEESCGYVDAQVAFDFSETAFTFEIPYITREFSLDREDYVAIQQHLADQAVDMTISTDKTGQIYGFTFSESVNLDDVAVELGLAKRIEGPWIIEVPFYPLD